MLGLTAGSPPKNNNKEELFDYGFWGGFFTHSKTHNQTIKHQSETRKVKDGQTNLLKVEA